MRKFKDIVIIPDDSQTPLRYRIKIAGEPLEETFPGLEEAKSAALEAVRTVSMEVEA